MSKRKTGNLQLAHEGLDTHITYGVSKMTDTAYQYTTFHGRSDFRRNSIRILCALTLLGFFIATPFPVSAQTSSAPSGAPSVMDRIRAKMQEKKTAPTESERWFDNLDLDKSGDISKQELFESIRKRFDAMDTNGDKGVTLAEYMKLRKDGVSGEARFGRLDTNKDGVLDMSEFASPADWRFDRIDRNSDGVISRAEADRLFELSEQTGNSRNEGQCFYVDRQIIRVKEEAAESLIKRGFPKADCQWTPDVIEQEKTKQNDN